MHYENLWKSLFLTLIEGNRSKFWNLIQGGFGDKPFESVPLIIPKYELPILVPSLEEK